MEFTEREIVEYIIKYLTILKNSFKVKGEEKLTFPQIFEIMNDLVPLFDEYFHRNPVKCSELAIKEYIPLLDTLIKIDKNSKHYMEYSKQVKNAYRIGARTSLEHYMIYREWEDKPEDKFFAPRYEAIRGYIYYLEQVVKNPNFRLLIFNAMSGFGKTYPEKISEAWGFGNDPTGTTLALCSNEDVVTGGSSIVRDEIKSVWFGEVFENLKYSEDDKTFFLKQTDANWKLRDCKLSASYYAKTLGAYVIGVRASQRIHIDDLYADYREAMNQQLNKFYLDKFNTVWAKRFVQHKIPKVVVTGTLWASGDFINLLINQTKKDNVLHPHPKFKYTYVNDDETVVIIQLPALDYETGLSTCPELKTTIELLKEKSNIDEYLWETNFQQKPTDPEALQFSYDKLRTYSAIPHTDITGSYAVIDATRKSGKDYFAMPIFSKVPVGDGYDYYLKDALFTKTATKDMYADVCNMIIEHHINELVIESNVTSELKQNILEILAKNGVFFCKIVEKYNTENKAARIEDQKSNILNKLVFPEKGKFGINSQIGLYMENLTLYNAEGRNANDDAPDSSALFTKQFVELGVKPNKIQVIRRPF